MERTLFFSGNEAIAHGAVRAGAAFACGYPGTPSTEILETAARLEGIHAQWCVNEKVALETAVGASLAGVRSMVTMKHVGLNVAADPLMTLSLTGVNAGLVIVSADDPGMHSSQNEQDSRNYAKFAKIPMLEPSDSQEAYDFVAEAFSLSEEFDTPVLLRSTTRLSHGRGQVIPRVPVELAPRGYERDIGKYVMVPQYARLRNRVVIERLQRLRERAEESPLNVLEAGTAEVGIIASGVAYTYAREAFPKAWFLKLGMSHPLPIRQGRAALPAGVAGRRGRGARPLHRGPGPRSRPAGNGQRGDPRGGRARPGHRLPRPRAVSLAPAPAPPPPGLSAGAASRRPAARRRPAGAPAGALRRLHAPRGVRRAAASQAGAHGRHRLLLAGRAAAPAGSGQLPLHGRQHRHDGRLQQGSGA